MNWVSQLLGFAGIAANVWIYQQKDRSKLLGCKLLSDVLWLLHYGTGGAYSAAAIALIGIARELVFLHWAKHGTRSRAVLVLFLAAAAGSAAITWRGAASLLPAAASMIAVVSFWIGRPALSRGLALPVSGCMLAYDVCVGSIAGCANECLTVISVVIGWIRCDRVQREKIPEKK